MPRTKRWMALTVLLALPLSACGGSAGKTAAEISPSRVVSVKGSKDLHRVVLTAQAITRIGLVTVPIRTAPAGAGAAQTVIPYGALIYDANGATWTYTSVAPRTYQRSSITVERVSGDLAYLSKGPQVGTTVVSVGAAELFGTEFFADHE